MAIRTAAGVSFTIGDHQGTAILSVDAATGAATRRRTTPFGAPRGAQPGAWPGQRGFVGGPVDEQEGLTHLGAREYDPLIGGSASGGLATIDVAPARYESLERLDQEPEVSQAFVRLFAPATGGISMVSKL